MARTARRSLVALVFVAGVLGVAVPSGAVVPGVVDLAASIASVPETVSPPGELVLYQATASNVGLVPTSSGELTVALPGNAVYRDDLSTAACSGAGTLVTCPTGPLARGTTVAFDVAAHTPTSPGSHQATATVRSTDVFEPAEFEGNNTATATTTVLASNPGVAAGLVESGESLTLDVADGRSYTLTVPPGAGPGVIVKGISAEDGAGHDCGTVGCGNGFVTDFVQHPYFKAEHPLHPLITVKTFGAHDPCQGLGNATCNSIYFAHSNNAIALTPMPFCPGAGGGGTPGNGTAIPSPCVNQLFKSGGRTWFDVRMLSNDPIELPPLKSVG